MQNIFFSVRNPAALQNRLMSQNPFLQPNFNNPNNMMNTLENFTKVKTFLRLCVISLLTIDKFYFLTATFNKFIQSILIAKQQCKLKNLSNKEKKKFLPYVFKLTEKLQNQQAVPGNPTQQQLAAQFAQRQQQINGNKPLIGQLMKREYQSEGQHDISPPSKKVRAEGSEAVR